MSYAPYQIYFVLLIIVFVGQALMIIGFLAEIAGHLKSISVLLAGIAEQYLDDGKEGAQ